MGCWPGSGAGLLGWMAAGAGWHGLLGVLDGNETHTCVGMYLAAILASCSPTAQKCFVCFVQSAGVVLCFFCLCFCVCVCVYVHVCVCVFVFVFVFVYVCVCR